MSENSSGGDRGKAGGAGADDGEEITEVRLLPGRERTLEEERRFLAKLFAEAIGHDGWLVPVIGGETGKGEKNG